MWEQLVFYVKSVICSGLFRLRGVHSSWILCDGLLPKLDARGKVIIGEKLLVHGRILPCNVGVARAGYLHIGDRVFANQGLSSSLPAGSR